jgi:hypothetical protein
MKALAIVGRPVDIQPFNDTDIDLTLECWLWQDQVSSGGHQIHVNFDGAASTTTILSRIVGQIVDYANAHGFDAIDRKDVLIVPWIRG